jgi:hypothetical protein
MKTKKEIIDDYIINAEEALLKIQIRLDYLRNKYAKDSKQAYMQDMAQMTTDKKETEEWLAFLKEQAGKG